MSVDGRNEVGKQEVQSACDVGDLVGSSEDGGGGRGQSTRQGRTSNSSDLPRSLALVLAAPHRTVVASCTIQGPINTLLIIHTISSHKHISSDVRC